MCSRVHCCGFCCIIISVAQCAFSFNAKLMTQIVNVWCTPLPWAREKASLRRPGDSSVFMQKCCTTWSQLRQWEMTINHFMCAQFSTLLALFILIIFVIPPMLSSHWSDAQLLTRIRKMWLSRVIKMEREENILKKRSSAHSHTFQLFFYLELVLMHRHTHTCDAEIPCATAGCRRFVEHEFPTKSPFQKSAE